MPADWSGVVAAPPLQSALIVNYLFGLGPGRGGLTARF